MHDAERYRLLFGPYAAPPFAYGQVLPCAVRGPAIVCGLSAGRIPWPVGKRGPRGSARFLIITGGLAEAVRRESAGAVSYWWGVGRDCVTTWRQGLGGAAEQRGHAPAAPRLRRRARGAPGAGESLGQGPGPAAAGEDRGGPPRQAPPGGGEAEAVPAAAGPASVPGDAPQDG